MRTQNLQTFFSAESFTSDCIPMVLTPAPLIPAGSTAAFGIVEESSRGHRWGMSYTPCMHPHPTGRNLSCTLLLRHGPQKTRSRAKELISCADLGGRIEVALVLVTWLDFSKKVVPQYDHYTFARGMFANPLVTWNRGPGTGFLRSVEMKLFMGTALASSLLDWPLRWLSRHLLCSRTVRVASSPSSMDDRISSELWQTSCRIVSVPDRINT